ncbi:MAG TPA: pitrilysin family protein [Thermoanaerobaculia bacterium]|nr:pitrilysin family protein [Thermoanaerobaculia bacterium]
MIKAGFVSALALSFALLPDAPAEPPGSAGGAIPARPEQIRFEPLAFEVPDPGPMRHRVAGVPVYVAEDHALPLVDVTVLLRAGAFLDPPGREGLAAMTATLVRRGGTARRGAAELEEAVEALAARIDSTAGDAYATVSLNCLSSRLDEALDLLFEMIAEPAFEPGAVEAEKRRMVAAMRPRNDEPGRILDREWVWLLYGRDHVAGRYPTAPSVAPVSQSDLAAFHARSWSPANMVLAVSGDVDRKAVLARLEARLAAWKKRGRPVAWPPPPSGHRPVPGLYGVDKEAPQAQVVIGRLAPAWEGRWDDRGRYAALVADQTLGGGDFSSRLMSRLRTREGLVYGVRSELGIGALWPEPFEVRFAAAPANVARAVAGVFDELRRLRDERVGAGELETAKSLLLAELADTFGSARKTAATFALDEVLGRPHAFWRGYRARLLAVTPADVEAAARRSLNPEEMLILVVGSGSRVSAGDAARALPAPRLLPLRDPLTLAPLP